MYVALAIPLSLALGDVYFFVESKKLKYLIFSIPLKITC